MAQKLVQNKTEKERGREKRERRREYACMRVYVCENYKIKIWDGKNIRNYLLKEKRWYADSFRSFRQNLTEILVESTCL